MEEEKRQRRYSSYDSEAAVFAMRDETRLRLRASLNAERLKGTSCKDSVKAVRCVCNMIDVAAANGCSRRAALIVMSSEALQRVISYLSLASIDKRCQFGRRRRKKLRSRGVGVTRERPPQRSSLFFVII